MTESFIYSIVRLVSLFGIVSIALVFAGYLMYQMWLSKRAFEAERYRIDIIHMNETWFTAGIVVGLHGRILKLEEFQNMVAQTNPTRGEEIEAFVNAMEARDDPS